MRKREFYDILIRCGIVFAAIGLIGLIVTGIFVLILVIGE